MFIRDIIVATAREFQILPADILSSKRTKHIILARQKAMWRARTELNASYLKIGRIFKRDHSTVIHNVRRWDARERGTLYIKPRKSLVERPELCVNS